MPCYGPDGPPNVRSDIAEARLSKAYKEIDAATQAACEMAKYFRRNGGFDALSKSTRNWINNHELFDLKRSKK